uniref:J domain-containing protein n=1 Tax=Alexandrium catenella TaxID=2925 RepID=A0A7S1SFU5_ALECA|mmetsp:Transcript_99772/g.265177  ORF Transcript_99772/g.265177 Transcript_99772/m.265177 type:complete len:202 (+) Transcript_99772:2-607(+)
MQQAIPQQVQGGMAIPRVVPAPPDDLMELGVTASPSPPTPSPVGSVGGSPSRSPPTPTPPLDRAKLVAEREAAEKARVDEANRVHAERRQSEEQLKKDKLKMSNKLYAEMDGWAKTPDMQSFKDIRTLLSTVHTVMWPNAGWQPLTLSELVAKDSNVKKYYRKAVLMCHPDKQTEADPERQVRADRIFQALNEAFKASGGD